MDAREERAESSLPPMPDVEVDGWIEELPDGPVAIDRRLMRELAPRLASYELTFGRMLSTFFAARGWRVLGFASEKQYAVERLGMSRSSVHGLMTLAKRAVHLEKVGDALHEGKIGSVAASLIARVATPDTEEAWIERAAQRTHKHFEQEVVAAERIARMMRLEEPPGPPSVDEIEVVLALERDMRCGAYARRAFGLAREDDARDDLDGRVAAAPESMSAEMARRALAVQESLRTLVLLAREGTDSLTPEQAEAACTGCTEPEGPLPTIDLEEDVVWFAGVPSDETTEGSSEPDFPMFGAAHPAGDRAGFEASESVVQMFGPAEPAAGASSEAGESVVQMFGPADPVARCERTSGAESAAAEGAGVDVAASEDARREMLRRWGVVTLRVRAPEETILHYRMLKAAYERAGMGGSFARFLVVSFWSSWAEVLGRTNRCEEILRRDGYECTCPVCGRPAAPGSHHLRYRSHGGGDEAWNQTSPCSFCHIEGEHGGRLRVRGEAPDLLTWLIGRNPILEVRGRERRLLAA